MSVTTDTPLWSAFGKIVAQRGDRVALLQGNCRLTFADLQRRAILVADHLSHIGLRQGDRVLMRFAGRADEVAVPLALWRIGAVPVPLDATMSDADLQLRADLLDASAIVTLGEGGSAPSLDVRRLEPTRQTVALPGLGSVVFTSGSSGTPKGVMQTQASLLSASRRVAAALGYGPDDRLLCSVSWGHDYGWLQLLSVCVTGTAMALPERRTPAQLAEAIERHCPTVLGGIPSVYGALTHGISDISTCDRRSVRLLMSTGSALSSTVHDALCDLFPDARLSLNYGLTETLRTATLAPEDTHLAPHAAGCALPGVRIVIADEEGQECRPGDEGEIIHLGAGAFAGYWGDPERSARTMRPLDGVKASGLTTVRTGDIGAMDDRGVLYVTGRRDRVIKSMGLKVSLSAVEAAFGSMPATRESAVVPFGHNILGQALCLFIVPQAGATLGKSDITRFARRTLPPEMRPLQVHILPDLPKTMGGKTDMAALAKMLQGRSSA